MVKRRDRNRWSGTVDLRESLGRIGLNLVVVSRGPGNRHEPMGDSLSTEESAQDPPIVSAGQRNGEGFSAKLMDDPSHIDPFAAWIAQKACGPIELANVKPRQANPLVEGRIERDRDDHPPCHG